MALAVNKSALTNFLCQYICDNAPKSRELVSHPDKKIYLSGGLINGEETVCISSQGSIKVPELFCNHEEADTRMIYHASESDKVFTTN